MVTILLIFGVLLLDQATKWLVIRRMFLHQSIPVIQNVFHLTYVKNYGAAFSIFAHRTGFFIIVSLVVILLIVYILYRLPGEHILLRVALALQLGGALGNLLDRARLGYVVDFLDFRIWPVFNVADIALVAGIGLLIIDLARTPREKGI